MKKEKTAEKENRSAGRAKAAKAGGVKTAKEKEAGSTGSVKTAKEKEADGARTAKAAKAGGARTAKKRRSVFGERLAEYYDELKWLYMELYDD